MEDQITVNGRVLSIRRLLGKGKGGYSYLAADERWRIRRQADPPRAMRVLSVRGQACRRAA
ncbi:MAG: hypothetical protein ACLS3C_04240 [Oscillospiraceae bacterium]